MLNQNLIIIGAGSGYSFSLATLFGHKGYKIGLISRSSAKLESLCEALKEDGIDAYWAAGDAAQASSLESAITRLKVQMGNISFLVYNAARFKMVDILKDSVESLASDFKTNTLNALSCVQFLKDDLLAAKGHVLFTGSGLNKNPVPLFGSLSLGKAALHSLAFMLHERLKEEDIFVGIVTINGFIQEQDPIYAPEKIAEKAWEFVTARKEAEIIV
tara:strand:+ start:127 stop:774 length:648 start_codon:yes stop_codon:yes gene_type:complete